MKVVHRGKAEDRPALKPKPDAIVVSHCQPSCICPVTVLLWSDVRHILFSHGALIQADKCRRLTVSIILMRTPAVPCQVSKPFGHCHLHPHTGYLFQLQVSFGETE